MQGHIHEGSVGTVPDRALVHAWDGNVVTCLLRLKVNIVQTQKALYIGKYSNSYSTLHSTFNQ